MSLVSVVVPAYNAERWLAEALDSALAQTYSDVEVIVVDDGSSDETLAVARRYEGGRVRVIAQVNQGACVARNRGLAEARGEFVKFLDADDVLALDAVEIQTHHAPLKNAPHRIIPFGDLITTNEHLVPEVRTDADWKLPFDKVLSASPVDRVEALLSFNIQTSLPLHRKDWLLKVGGFDTHLKKAQEYDLHIRLALDGIRFIHVPHVVTYLRHHASPDRITNKSPLLSDPGAKLTVLQERRQMIEEHLGRPLPEPLAAAMATGVWKQTRRLVQIGDLSAAGRYATEGVYLDPDVRHAGKSFHLLSKAFGPVSAERILMSARRLSGRRSLTTDTYQRGI